MTAAEERTPLLRIPEDAWSPCGDEEEPGGERAVLTASMRGPGDVWFYATALEVSPVGEFQTALQWDIDLEGIHEVSGASGPLATVEIGGRQYIICVTPEER